MPEYLTPGVYLEETSFRSKSIEGVPTSTFGMAGLTRYGPVPYVQGTTVMVPRPTLITSFTEFERAFGGLGTDGTLAGSPLYLAYAARAFFENGGRRLYVSRVFPFAPDPKGMVESFATGAIDKVAWWRARWPGTAGASIKVAVTFQRGKNILLHRTDGPSYLQGMNGNETVEMFANAAAIPKEGAKDFDPKPDKIRIVKKNLDGSFELLKADKSTEKLPTGAVQICHLGVTVEVSLDSRRDTYVGLEIGPDHRRSISKVLSAGTPTDEFSLVWFDATGKTTADIATALVANSEASVFLTGGSEGTGLTADVLNGDKADPDDVKIAATGLAALGDIDDIAIVATPDTVALDDTQQKTAVDNLLTHCQQLRYRIAIVDPPRDSSIAKVREFRSKFDSSYGALYYPWMTVVDPTAKPEPGAPPATVSLPPSGFAAGIYARSDIARGVHKAPANEVIYGLTGFEQNVTFDRQSVLNPEGINALRFFPGRSNRVWGARTMSSDPEWKYVNVRRLFIYLEHSIDKSTQWAVFEPNNERLWANIRQTLEDFLVVTWKTGAFMGTKPEEAFFVRCDRTTMTQNDLDNGRLICLIGVAPTYPAEFVIFRIGQWTADSQQS